MDLGRFRRRKTEFWAWMVGPVILIAVAGTSLWAYCRYLDASLDQRLALLRLVPDMSVKLMQAKKTVNAFSQMPEDGDVPAPDIVRAHINRTAQRNRFIVNSLSILTRSVDEKAGGVMLNVSLQGEGSFQGLVGFLDELHRSKGLTRAIQGRLKLAGFQPEPRYEGEFIFRCYVLSP